MKNPAGGKPSGVCRCKALTLMFRPSPRLLTSTTCSCKSLQVEFSAKTAEIPPTFQRRFLKWEYRSSNPPGADLICSLISVSSLSSTAFSRRPPVPAFDKHRNRSSSSAAPGVHANTRPPASVNAFSASAAEICLSLITDDSSSVAERKKGIGAFECVCTTSIHEPDAQGRDGPFALRNSMLVQSAQ